VLAINKKSAECGLQLGEVRRDRPAEIHSRRWSIECIVMAEERTQCATVIEKAHLDVLGQDAFEPDFDEQYGLAWRRCFRTNGRHRRPQWWIGASNAS
jgi:hypothetical protein